MHVTVTERNQLHKFIFERFKRDLKSVGSFKNSNKVKYSIQDSEEVTLEVIGAVFQVSSYSNTQILI